MKFPGGRILQSEEGPVKAGFAEVPGEQPGTATRLLGPIDYRCRWGIVLAGGDGVRLQPLTRTIYGDNRPKQFCPLFGSTTILGDALRRARLAIPRDQILVSLTTDHSRYFTRQQDLLPAQRVIQPMNKGTAPPIIHGIMSIEALDPNALVAILPSDHRYEDEPSFLAALDSAFDAADATPESVIVLGAPPNRPEPDFGWIALGPKTRRPNGLFAVRAFWEKPGVETARELLAQGALWNTFVMVGRARAFLNMARSAVPHLLDALALAHLWNRKETSIGLSTYRLIPSIDFSRDVLSVQTGRLQVLPLGDVGWNDLGDPDRVLSLAAACNVTPRWLHVWSRMREQGTVPIAAPHRVVA